MKKQFLGLLLLITAAFPVFSAMEVFEFETPEQETVFKKLGKELRCPKCQNNNIADSNSSLAQDLRVKVYEMLKQGKSEDEIVDYMIDRYGNFVTYNPPLSLSTAILWIAPILFLVLGFTVLILSSRKPKAEKINPVLEEEEAVRLQALLNEKNQKDQD